MHLKESVYGDRIKKYIDLFFIFSHVSTMKNKKLDLNEKFHLKRKHKKNNNKLFIFFLMTKGY